MFFLILSFILIAGLAGTGYYFYKKHQPEGEYIWVGQGKDPFRKN